MNEKLEIEALDSVIIFLLTESVLRRNKCNRQERVGYLSKVKVFGVAPWPGQNPPATGDYPVFFWSSIGTVSKEQVGSCGERSVGRRYWTTAETACY